MDAEHVFGQQHDEIGPAPGVGERIASDRHRAVELLQVDRSQAGAGYERGVPDRGDSVRKIYGLKRLAPEECGFRDGGQIRIGGIEALDVRAEETFLSDGFDRPGEYDIAVDLTVLERPVADLLEVGSL